MEDLTDQDVTDMVSEIITILTNDIEEHENVEEAGDCFIDWSNVLHKREEKVKELVTAIQEDVTKMENKFLQIQTGPEARELTEVDTQLESSRESYQIARKAVEDVEKQTAEIEREQQNLLQLQEEEDHKTVTILPNNRKELNLYKYVTNIRWDFSAPSDEIKGLIANSKSVRPIDYNSSENSKFFITNSIWDSIEPDWG